MINQKSGKRNRAIAGTASQSPLQRDLPRVGGTLTRRATEAIASAAAIAAGTQAYGTAIRFENPDGPGHFVWAEPQGQNSSWLNITADASSQTGAPSAISFHHVISGSSGLVQTDGSGAAYAEVNGYLVHSVEAGVLIPSGISWQTSGYSYYAFYGTTIPDGVPRYIGVKFDLGGGFHYGWIGVLRSGPLSPELDAFAWGYETEVGVPIAAGAGIPAPGTLAMLAFGALAGGSRKRKNS